MVYRKIPFQRWRLFWFGMRHVTKAAALMEENRELAMAYKQIADLATEAIKSINAGRPQDFVNKLDRLLEASEGKTGISELDALIARQREQDRGY